MLVVDRNCQQSDVAAVPQREKNVSYLCENCRFSTFTRAEQQHFDGLWLIGLGAALLWRLVIRPVIVLWSVISARATQISHLSLAYTLVCCCSSLILLVDVFVTNLIAFFLLLIRVFCLGRTFVGGFDK